MSTKKTIGIRVPIKQAEHIRKYLSENKLLRKDLKISKNKKFIYFPVKKIPKDINFHKIKIIREKFEKRDIKPKTYKETISIPEKLRNNLPTSYDVIGDIILIKLPKNLLEYKKEIGKSLLKANKNINVVCLVEPVTGELRTRNIKIITGEKRTKTTHTEYGLKFEIDVKKTYFSPRLATERKRIATLVKPDEIVVDMFTGVAPFSIMIAKYANPKIIYAVDKNQEAIKYAQKNILRNKMLDKIEVIHTDAKKIHKILYKKDTKADRIIMNLPFSAYMFFPYTLKIAAANCTIHYYDILKEEKVQERLESLKQIAKENKTILTDLDIRRIKTYAPREFYIGIDIRAKKSMPM